VSKMRFSAIGALAAAGALGCALAQSDECTVSTAEGFDFQVGIHAGRLLILLAFHGRSALCSLRSNVFSPPKPRRNAGDFPRPRVRVVVLPGVFQAQDVRHDVRHCCLQLDVILLMILSHLQA